MNNLVSYYKNLDFSTTIKRQEEIKKKYGISTIYNFNIFTSMSDTFWRENLHSQVLRDILDPKTEVIGKQQSIKMLFKMLDIDEKISWSDLIVEVEVSEQKLETILSNQGVEFKKKKETLHVEGRIDILVLDCKNKYAIVIENKINSAPDMENQLWRYNNMLENYDISVKKIVYMPLTSDKKLPLIQSEIKDKVKYVPVVKSTEEQSSDEPTILNDFIKPLLKLEGEITKENATRYIFIEQYRNLLAKLGEHELMRETERELVKEMCETKAKNECFLILKKLFDNKMSEFYQIKAKIVTDELYDNKITDSRKLKDYGEVSCGKIGKRDIYFYTDGLWQLGIAIPNSKKSRTSVDFNTLIPKKAELEKKIKDYSIITAPHESNYDWIYFDFDEEFRLNKSIDEIVQKIKEYKNIFIEFLN